ncbi:MAG: DUF3862 domain-containing protein [Acidobacteriota bacterium]|nr:DUF3862 domain-containing protein [Acidobacteriota bacterium]MDH3531066.1 DUF3862 domain-containing protein [Acidobacteriota bacterium]
MKKSLSLVLVALLFVVLGCSLDRFTGPGESAPTPAGDTTSDSKSDDKSGDDKSDESKGGDGLTMENYEKIKSGMSYDDVAELLGSKGSETSSRSSGKSEYKSYKWEGDNYVRVYVNFKDDEMTSKSQTGLKSGSSSKSSSDITMAKYEKIENGMSVSEVEEIIGSKGEETSSSSIGNSSYKSYRWKGDKFSFISVRFKDDKVNSKSQYGLK